MTGPTPDRPLVTFALFAYNQEQYIREAVEGAFSQTYSPLEIILSDDCSSDRTFGVMQEMASTYQGPHTVRVRQSDTNKGLGYHVNTVLQQARGEIWVLAAGDDVSLPDRCQISYECLKRHPSATAVLLSADVINEKNQVVGERVNGRLSTKETTQALSQLLSWTHITFGATRAVRRSVWDHFGPLSPDCPTEDTPFLLRSLLCGENVLSRHKAIRYRRHDANLSSAASLNRMNTNEIYRQYSADIEKARELGFISRATKQKLEHWMEADQKIRELRLKLSLKQPMSTSELLNVVLHPATRIGNKLKLLSRVFSTRRTNQE